MEVLASHVYVVDDMISRQVEERKMPAFLAVAMTAQLAHILKWSSQNPLYSISYYDHGSCRSESDGPTIVFTSSDIVFLELR